MFFAISRNGTLFIFITASYENVSSIHMLHSQCLTWTCCIKSQSCVHKFNIFFPFTATQWPTLQNGNVCILIQTISFLHPSNSFGIFDSKSWIFDLNNNFIASEPLCSARKWIPVTLCRRSRLQFLTHVMKIIFFYIYI